jgi:hypothetical protein
LTQHRSCERDHVGERTSPPVSERCWPIT